MVRAARQAEKDRKKEETEAAKARNRGFHDMIYAAKFAPRDRATKVNLPGRIGKTAFNAYDAEAAAADAAAAPATAEPGAGGLGMGLGSPGMGAPGRRPSTAPGGRGGDDWHDDM